VHNIPAQDSDNSHEKRKRSSSFDLSGVNEVLKKVKVQRLPGDLRLKKDFEALEAEFGPWAVFNVNDPDVNDHNIEEFANHYASGGHTTHGSVPKPYPIGGSILKTRIRAFSGRLGVIISRKDNLSQVYITIKNQEYVVRIPKKYPFEPPIVNRVDLHTPYNEGIGGAMASKHRSRTPTNFSSSCMNDVTFAHSCYEIVVKLSQPPYNHCQAPPPPNKDPNVFIWDATKSLKDVIIFLKGVQVRERKISMGSIGDGDGDGDGNGDGNGDDDDDDEEERGGMEGGVSMFASTFPRGNKSTSNRASQFSSLSPPPPPPLSSFSDRPSDRKSLTRPTASGAFGSNRHDVGFPKDGDIRLSDFKKRNHASMDFSNLNWGKTNNDDDNHKYNFSGIGGDFRNSSTNDIMDDESPVKSRKNSVASEDSQEEGMYHDATGVKRDLNSHDFYEDGDFF